jgi:hypothetical protein
MKGESSDLSFDRMPLLISEFQRLCRTRNGVAHHEQFMRLVGQPELLE